MSFRYIFNPFLSSNENIDANKYEIIYKLHKKYGQLNPDYSSEIHSPYYRISRVLGHSDTASPPQKALDACRS